MTDLNGMVMEKKAKDNGEYAETRTNSPRRHSVRSGELIKQTKHGPKGPLREPSAAITVVKAALEAFQRRPG